MHICWNCTLYLWIQWPWPFGDLWLWLWPWPLCDLDLCMVAWLLLLMRYIYMSKLYFCWWRPWPWRDLDQNLITCSHDIQELSCEVWWDSVKKCGSQTVNRQTDRQTDKQTNRQTNRTKNITSLGGGNNESFFPQQPLKSVKLVFIIFPTFPL